MGLTVTRVMAALAFGLSAWANPIVIFSTGVDAGGNPLSVGGADPHYRLVSAPSGVPLTAVATSPHPAWTPNTSTADWISPGNSGSTSWPVGTYDYQTTFDLTGLDPSTAQLSGFGTSDNDGCIFLNGVDTGSCDGFAQFGTLLPFSITSGFKPGINTLDLIVNNGGEVPSPTGVILEVSGTAAPLSSVPEPSSLSFFLAGGGLFGICTLRRRLFRLKA